MTSILTWLNRFNRFHTDERIPNEVFFTKIKMY